MPLSKPRAIACIWCAGIAIFSLFWIVERAEGRFFNGGAVLCFRGEAQGGELSITTGISVAPAVWSLKTSRGESADSVHRRFGAAIDHAVFCEDGNYVDVEMAFLGGGGTETGLSIPLPPRNLTTCVDPASGSVRAYWEYEDADLINHSVVRSWTFSDYRFLEDKTTIVATSTALHIETPLPDDEYRNLLRMERQEDSFRRRQLAITTRADDRLIFVMAYKKSAPSSIAHMYLSAPWMQEELADFPFREGVAPNWSKWSAADAQKVQGLEGIRVPDDTMEDIKHPASSRTRYQILRPELPGLAIGGIYRKFLCLSKARKYTVRMRIRVDGPVGNFERWTMAPLAIIDDREDGRLTHEEITEQLANWDIKDDHGVRLIDGWEDERYKTDENWSIVSFTVDMAQEPFASKWRDESVDLVIALRLEALSSKKLEDVGSVSMDWISLEDLTLRANMEAE